MHFYVSVFPNSKITTLQRYPEGITEGPIAGMDGKVLTGIFELNGMQFMCLDGGPGVFSFDKAAISFQIECENQEEVDHYWNKLSAVPEAEQCGWVKDKFGIAWQITPKQLGKLLMDPDKEKSGRVMAAMMQMKKIIIADLEKAAAGK